MDHSKNEMGFEPAHIQSILYFVSHSEPVTISDEQALDVIAQLRTPHLDAGDLILTFGAQENKPSNLFTGDKRALKAVNRMQHNGVLAMEGCHMLVLEEAIRLLMMCGDKDQVIASIQSRPHVDKAIDICFRDIASVDDALNSDIESIRSQCSLLSVIRVNPKYLLTWKFGLLFALDNVCYPAHQFLMRSTRTEGFPRC